MRSFLLYIDYRPKAPSTLPVTKGDYIHRECKATTKYIATGAGGKTVPTKVFQHLKHNNKFKDGYFSTREEEHGKITKVITCHVKPLV